MKQHEIAAMDELLLDSMIEMRELLEEKWDEFPRDLHQLRKLSELWNMPVTHVIFAVMQVLSYFIGGWVGLLGCISVGVVVGCLDLVYKRRRRRMVRSMSDYIEAMRGNRVEEKWLEMVIVAHWKKLHPVPFGKRSVDQWVKKKYHGRTIGSSGK